MHCQLPIEGVLHKALDWGYTQTNIVYDLCVFGSYYQTENNSYSTRCIYGKPTVFTRTRSIIIMNTISNKWIKTIQDQTNNYVTNQKFKSKAFNVSIYLNYFSLYRYNWFGFIGLLVSKWYDVSLSNFVQNDRFVFRLCLVSEMCKDKACVDELITYSVSLSILYIHADSIQLLLLRSKAWPEKILGHS